MDELAKLKLEVEATQFWTANLLATSLARGGFDENVVTSVIDALKNHSPERSSSGLSPSDFDEMHLAKLPAYIAFGEMIAENLRGRSRWNGA